MNIIDSSFWIEYFTDGKYADFVEKTINDCDNLLIPTVIISEVFKWILREKGEMEAIAAVSSMKTGKVVDLTEEIAINSAYYSLKNILAFADSLIFSTVNFYDATLYTLDKHFKGLDNVKYFEKEKEHN